MAWGPEPHEVKHLDFSQFHALDHWPFTAYCRDQYGGGRHHLHLAWEYRRRDQLLGWWFMLTGCWLRGKHREQVWRSGDKAGVRCSYCSWTRTPSEAELERFPRHVFNPGDGEGP